jgi:uncharacterized protein YaaR (DUF327 family)
MDMAEIINLKDVRKARARAAAEAKAAENRTRFGRTRDERNRQALEEQRAQREHEGNRLERSPAVKAAEKNKDSKDSESGGQS